MDNQENHYCAGKNVALTVRVSYSVVVLQEITVSVEVFPFNNMSFGLQKKFELELSVCKSAVQPGICLL